jgi:hypothetical protein
LQISCRANFVNEPEPPEAARVIKKLQGKRIAAKIESDSMMKISTALAIYNYSLLERLEKKKEKCFLILQVQDPELCFQWVVLKKRQNNETNMWSLTIYNYNLQERLDKKSEKPNSDLSNNKLSLQ